MGFFVHNSNKNTVNSLIVSAHSNSQFNLNSSLIRKYVLSYFFVKCNENLFSLVVWLQISIILKRRREMYLKTLISNSQKFTKDKYIILYIIIYYQHILCLFVILVLFLHEGLRDGRNETFLNSSSKASLRIQKVLTVS